jgi:hypothetical protein
MTFEVKKGNLKLEYKVKRLLISKIKTVKNSLLKSNITTPVFVIGSGRSGTDLVVNCLSNSWQVDVYNEDNPKVFSNWRIRSFDEVDSVLKKNGSKIAVFKPIVETLRAQEFLTSFPSAKILFIARNPYDTISSISRFFGDGVKKAVNYWLSSGFKNHPQAPESIKNEIKKLAYPDMTVEDSAAIYWLMYNNSYYFLGLDKEKKVMLIQYESLINEPVYETKRICKFLDIKWTRSMTKYISDPIRKPKPKIDDKIEKKCLETWSRFITISNN